MSDLLAAARNAVSYCLKVQAGESVLVVSDPGTAAVGTALWQAARESGAEALFLQMQARHMHGEEPPAPVAAAMVNSQVCFLVTSKSLSHTRARREATAAGARIASLPGISEAAMIRTLQADYGAIEALSRRLAEVLTRGRLAEIIGPGGSRLTFGLDSRIGQVDGGLYWEKGAFGNLPAGEAYIAPLEGTAAGKLVVDGSIAGIGRLEEPLTLEFAEGYLRGIYGGRQARQLEEILQPYGPEARNLAELGIGTNEKAILTGSPLEDEKIKGSLHVALGANANFGGIVEVPLHLDAIVLKPTLLIDGQVIISQGQLRLGE
ncbi:MAG: 2,5-dihydroxypyridine 5,6-dioxygenase [Clostridia bacterium]|nr:2,5-dihydroxypyridine 5,6-dioxygenase [Clostridia bacterium]